MFIRNCCQLLANEWVGRCIVDKDFGVTGISRYWFSITILMYANTTINVSVCFSSSKSKNVAKMFFICLFNKNYCLYFQFTAQR